MINRFPTRCVTCDGLNTLRVTIGVDTHQEHTFACAHCGEAARISLSLDFEDRVKLEPPFGSAPRIKNVVYDGCVEAQEEGVVTNLDPTFLIPEGKLHEDKTFTWMEEYNRIGLLEPEKVQKGSMNDVIIGVGGQRHVRDVLSNFVKAYDLDARGKPQLMAAKLSELEKWMGIRPNTLQEAAWVIAQAIAGRGRAAEIAAVLSEARNCLSADPKEARRLITYYHERCFADEFARQVEVFREYLRGYDQFFQAWIYASRQVKVEGRVVAMGSDLNKVKMFYGNAFEQLSSGLWLAAALNNIKLGRPYDRFQHMDLKKYLGINKARRAEAFADNPGFHPLWSEFDSTLRNASHHGALRIAHAQPSQLEYRAGDSGGWQRISMADYLVRCNRVLICLMQLLMLQLALHSSAK